MRALTRSAALIHQGFALRVLKRLGRLWLAVLMVTATGTFAAVSDIESLVDRGHLELDATLSPSGPVVPGQKLTLTLKFATDGWFSGGTRIKLPEVPGLVILQTEQFASNASERRRGRSWVIQRWTIDVYPQRAGDFTIPPVTARVEVNSDGADVEGSLRTTPVDFSVTLPPGLADVAHWVAAPDFSVEQHFDRPPGQLQVGEAIEREIVFEASDVMAMMLPTFTAEVIPGLAVYPLPPVLDNSSNRGQTLATRSQRISYVAQAEGQYLLPARDFFWWDTGSGELQVLTLPATQIVVGSGLRATAEEDSATLRITPRQILRAAGLVIAVLAALWLARTLLGRLPLAPVAAAIRAGWTTLKNLRKPALPERLNPGGNAGE